MLRRRHILWLLSCILLVGLVVWIIFGQRREPSYEGRSLSSWLGEIGGSGFSVQGQLVLSVSARENAAIDAVRHMGPEAYPLLIEMLKSKDGRVKKFILGKLGKHRAKFGLLTADEKRLRARTTLAFLGSRAAAAWKQVLLDPAISQDIRQLAIYQCPTMPEDAGQMIPAMMRLLTELQPDWRGLGWAAIRRFGPEAALPVLARQLQDPDRNIRLMSMSAMKYFGSSARPAIPILVQELGRSDKEMALAAADALLSIDAHNVPALVHQMHHAELGIRRVAYWSLAREEAPPETAVPEFMRGLSDREPEIREAAAESLAKYGTNARPALSGLTNLLSDEKRYVRRAATNAIESIVVLK